MASLLWLIGFCLLSHSAAHGSDLMVATALTKVERIYQDYLRPAGIEFSIRQHLGTSLREATVNRNGHQWFVDIYGGLFNKILMKHINRDYVYLVACHEIGHHLGGTVFYTGKQPWATGEGQADYYATLKCFRQVVADEDHFQWKVDFMTKSSPLLVQELLVAESRCHEAWTLEADQAVCTRASIASFQLLDNLIVNSGEKISLATAATERATFTSHDYPSKQCRLDTLHQGALCTVDYRVETSLTDPLAGNCQAGQHALGARPACWYAGE